MAKGFCQIDNGYFEALMAANLTRAGYKVVLAVIHKTWGWQKDSETISLTEFTKLTGLSRRGVIDTIRLVEAQGVVKVENTSPHTYKVNHYSDWNTGKAHLTGASKAGLTSNSTKTSPANDENFTRTSEVVKPATTHIKEKRYSLKKEDTLKEDDTYITPSVASLLRTTQPSGLTLIERITAYLQSKDSSPTQISADLGIPTQSVRMALSAAKKLELVVNVARGLWSLKGKPLPGEDTPPMASGDERW